MRRRQLQQNNAIGALKPVAVQVPELALSPTPAPTYIVQFANPDIVEAIYVFDGVTWPDVTKKRGGRPKGSKNKVKNVHNVG